MLDPADKGGVQAVHDGADPLKPPVVVLHARAVTAPKYPALQVQFHTPGIGAGCCVDKAEVGGTQSCGAIEPAGQKVPGWQGAAVPLREPGAQE